MNSPIFLEIISPRDLTDYFNEKYIQIKYQDHYGFYLFHVIANEDQIEEIQNQKSVYINKPLKKKIIS